MAKKATKEIKTVINAETVATPKTKGIKKSATKATTKVADTKATSNITKTTVTSFGQFCKDFNNGDKKELTAEMWASFNNPEPLENIKEHSIQLFNLLLAVMKERQEQELKEITDTDIRELQDKIKTNMDMWFRTLGIRPPNKKGGRNRPLYSYEPVDLANMYKWFADFYNELTAIDKSENCDDKEKAKENYVKEHLNDIFYQLVDMSGHYANGKKTQVVINVSYKATKKEMKKEKAERANKTRQANKENNPDFDAVAVDKLIAYMANLAEDERDAFKQFIEENKQTVKLKKAPSAKK